MIKNRMMAMRIQFLFLITCMFLIGCTSTQSKQDVTYTYRANDSSGNPVVEGTFTLVKSGDKQYTGQWNFKAIGNPVKIGPQVGEGSLSGQILENGMLAVNLNLNMADNNVYLTGKLEESKYAGEWHWSTFAGVANKGVFEAKVKQ
jgi:uncharacterized lipoprotein YajG